VLIEAGESGELGDWVGRVKSGPDGPMVVVVDKAPNPAAILSAFRAGADEFLYPPLEDNLRHALDRESDRLRRRSEASGPKGKILAFTSVKGGCGATTLACATAMELARRDQRGVVLLDLDFSCSLTGFLTGVRSAYSIADAIFNRHRLDLDYWNALISKGPEGIDVLPARLGGGPRRETDTDSLRQVLRFARQQYGWVVVDLGTAQQSFWTPAADELDLLMLVTTVDVMALYRCVRTLRELEDSGVPRSTLRVIANQAAGSAAMTSAELERAIGMPLEAIVPEDPTALRRWHAGDRALQPHSRLRRSLAELASALTDRPEGGTPAESSSVWRAAFAFMQPGRRNA
jgi:pilus assembly protein CpaE